ncbi:unnamed protein product [Diamesa hyperborea]
MDQGESAVEEIEDTGSVLLKVANLYAAHLLSDICLVVGANRYPAHRVILSASSEVFQVMLMNPEWSECKESVIELVEDPICCEIFPQFLKYLYTGHIRISIETAMPLLSLADKYNIKDLVTLCSDYMKTHIALAGKSGNLVSWLQYTLSFIYHENLTNELKNFLKYNLEIVAESKDFINLDPNILVVLLDQNDLVIENETTLFDIVAKWLFLKKGQIEQEESLSDEEKQEHLKTLIEAIMTHIRFPMMTVSELAAIPLKPITCLSKQFFCERIAIGMRYHVEQSETYENICESSKPALQFTPRLYLSDVFSFVMEVPEIQKIENYKNFGACFFSKTTLSECLSENKEYDESSIGWDIDLYPRGIQYKKAQLINVYNHPILYPGQAKYEIPETVLRSVRLKINCRAMLAYESIRFKIGVLICAIQNNITHIKTSFEKICYFSDETRVLNFDNIIAYDELISHNSLYLIGSERDTLRLYVTIIPLHQDLTQDSPMFELN